MTMSRRPISPTPPPSSQYSSHSSDAPNSSTTSPLTATSPPMAAAADDEIPTTPPPSRKPAHKPSFPPREDCWSEDATNTLIDAWGRRYLALKRGNLRQKDWRQVSDAVNAVHGHTAKLRRTDIQCKNRMDTVKKKYKIEKSRVSSSGGDYVSPWPFFARLDFLLTPPVKPSTPAVRPPPPTVRPPPSAVEYLPPTVVTRRRTPVLPLPPASVPVGRRSKRPAPAIVRFPTDESASKRKFSAMVVAAAAAAEKEDSGTPRNSDRVGSSEDGMRRLAEAIEKFAEIYERVENEKQRKMMELEEQKMRFQQDLEIQRMNYFTDSQLQFERIKRSKHFMDSPISRG